MQAKCELVKKGSIIVLRNKSNQKTKTEVLEKVSLFALAFLSQCMAIIVLNQIFDNLFWNELKQISNSNEFGGYSYLNLLAIINCFSMFMGSLVLSKTCIYFKDLKNQYIVEKFQKAVLFLVIGVFLFVLPFFLKMIQEVRFG